VLWLWMSKFFAIKSLYFLLKHITSSMYKEDTVINICLHYVQLLTPLTIWRIFFCNLKILFFSLFPSVCPCQYVNKSYRFWGKWDFLYITPHDPIIKLIRLPCISFKIQNFSNSLTVHKLSRSNMKIYVITTKCNEVFSNYYSKNPTFWRQTFSEIYEF
jgi:hypothetical protein